MTKHGQQMQLAQFSGILKVKNHKYELTAAEREPSQQLIGQMKSKELLIKNLEDLGFQDIEIGKDELIIPGTGCHTYSRDSTVKLKIPGKAILKSESGISVTFKL